MLLEHPVLAVTMMSPFCRAPDSWAFSITPPTVARRKDSLSLVITLFSRQRVINGRLSRKNHCSSSTRRVVKPTCNLTCTQHSQISTSQRRSDKFQPTYLLHHASAAELLQSTGYGSGLLVGHVSGQCLTAKKINCGTSAFLLTHSASACLNCTACWFLSRFNKNEVGTADM